MENDKLTPKQRAEIYLKAAKFFQKQLNWFVKTNKTHLQYFSVLPNNLKKYKNISGAWGFCDFIDIHTKNEFGIDEFSEYMSFRPRKSSIYWFYRQEDRVNALLLSYQMALDAKE